VVAECAVITVRGRRGAAEARMMIADDIEIRIGLNPVRDFDPQPIE
jgi:hypothetical protein